MKNFRRFAVLFCRLQRQFLDNHAVLRRAVAPESQRVLALLELDRDRLRVLPRSDGVGHLKDGLGRGGVHGEVDSLVVVRGDDFQG